MTSVNNIRGVSGSQIAVWAWSIYERGFQCRLVVTDDRRILFKKPQSGAQYKKVGMLKPEEMDYPESNFTIKSTIRSMKLQQEVAFTGPKIPYEPLVPQSKPVSSRNNISINISSVVAPPPVQSLQFVETDYILEDDEAERTNNRIYRIGQNDLIIQDSVGRLIRVSGVKFMALIQTALNMEITSIEKIPPVQSLNPAAIRQLATPDPGVITGAPGKMQPFKVK